MVKAIDILPKYDSTTQEWIDYHEALDNEFNKQDANAVWLKTWLKRGNSNANNVALREYLKEHDINIETSYVEELKDSLLDVTSYFKGNLKFMSIVVILLVVYILYIIAKNPQIIGLVATGGRSAMIPKS